MQLSRVAAVASKGADQLPVVAIENPYHVVGAISNQQILLFRVGGQGEVEYGPAGRVGHAPGSATVSPARLGGGVNPELFYERTFLGKDLDTVAAALADVNEAIARRMHAMHYGCELLLIRGWTRRIISGSGIVVDLAQRDAVTSPAALEGACIHIVYEHAFVQETVGDIDLPGVFVEVERSDAG